MTLPLNSRLSALYDTNGTQKDFSFGFRVFFDPDNGGYGLEVRRQTADGYEVIPKSDYLVLPVEDNSAGVVRFSVAPSAGQQIYIAGKTPTIQQLVLTNFGRYSAESIETQFDFITAIIQEWLSALGEETRQRMAADDILTQYVVQRIDDFVQQVNQNFDDKSQEIEDYIATIMPSFTQALRDEIEAFAVAGMQDAIDQTLAESKAEIDDAVARANAAALAAAITGKVYDTPEAGVDPVTGVQNGAYYNVRSTDDDSYLVEYQNIGGVPTPSGKSYPSSEKIKYIYENGAALPYKEGISYEENAVVVKDGELQQWKDGVWKSAIAGVVAVGSIADLLALPERSRREDSHYSVAGLTFSYNGSEFVNISGYITAEAFGAKFDGVVSDTLPLQEAIEYADAKNIPLVTFRRQCFLAEAVVVKSIVWYSLSTEFVTSEVGKPAIVAFNEAPKLLGVFHTTGAYDGTQSFPASVATAEHPPGSYAASTLDFIYTLPPASSDTGILFRFTQKQSGIRVGDVHADRHNTGVYWLSNSVPADEYTNDTVINAIYHKDVWCGIVMFGAVDFRCKTVKGSYFRRLPPYANDPAHCIYLGDRQNPFRSRDLTFDHVENLVTDRSPDDGVVTIKGANNVLIKTLIAHEASAGNTINGECRVENLYSYADEKVVPFVWITDNNAQGGAWSREQAGTSICVIENAVVRNNTGRDTDNLGSQRTALFACYGGSQFRGTYSSISVQKLDAVLGGDNPMQVAIQQGDEVCVRGKVLYNNYLTDPALYNYGDNNGAFSSWGALYPVVLLYPGTAVTQTVELEIIGYRWAVGTSGVPVNATFTCVPKDRVATEVVEQGAIRKGKDAYYSADSAGLTSAVTWTPYPFSYSHKHSYRSGFKADVYRLRTPLYAEPPVQYDTDGTAFSPYGQPLVAIMHTASTKQITNVQYLPVGQTCRLFNVGGDVTLVHGGALKCASAADYSAWLVADVVNMGGAQRLVAAY